MNEAVTAAKVAQDEPQRLDIFARWLSIWVVLCMIVGGALGKLCPGLTYALRPIAVGDGRPRNVSTAVPTVLRCSCM